MEKFHINTVVIGAGVVGLAIAKEICARKNEVIIIEKEGRIGQITSSRNSGVIHAGMYYKSNSLKAKFCVQGNQLLYAYAKKFNIPFINTKKIIVANNESQLGQVFEIKKQAELAKDQEKKLKQIQDELYNKILETEARLEREKKRA